MMACSAPAFARPECRPVPGDRRCWVVPDALAARLLQDASEDPGLQPDVALWLLELRDLCPVDDAVPGTLGWNPQLKIVYSRAALAPCTPFEDVSLDSGCYDTDSPQLSEKSPASEDPRSASPDSADGADRSLSRARTYENLADANRQAVLEQPESQWQKPSGPASVTATASQAPRMLASNPNTEVKEALRRQVGEEDLSEDDRASASASDSDSDRSVDSLEDDSRVVQRETVLSRLSGTEYHILPAVIEEEEEEEDGEAECEEEGSMVGACGHCSWGWRGVETLVRPCERCGHPSVTRNSLGGSVEVLCLESGSHCTVLWEPNPLFNCGAPCEPDHVCEVHKPSLCRATSDPSLAREPRFVQIDSLDMIGRSWKGRQESTYLCLDALEIAAQECGRLLEQTASVDSGMVFDDDFLALCFEASLLAETCIHDLGRDRPSAEGDVFEAHPRPKFDINAIFDRGGSGPPKPPARKRKRLRVKTVSASEVPPPSSVEDEVVQRRTCSESCEQQNQVSLDEEEIVKSLTTEHREQELLLMTRVSERTKLKRSRSAGARDVGPGATSRRALGPWTSPAEACLSSPELRSTHPLLVECGEPSLTSPAPELGEDVHAESSVVSDGSNELKRKGSVSSDVVAWKQDLLWSRLLSDEEDELATDFMNSDQWFSSSDSKGRVYFFEENSEESSWTLPNVVASSPQTHGLTSRELTDEDDYPPKGSTASLASQLAAQLAKYNKAALERASAERDTVSPTLSNNVERNERGDKLSLRATKSRSMVLVDLCDGKDSKSSAVPRNWPQLFDGDMCVLKEGTLNRTKITENGKKLRKNWASSHVVLTELFLLLFRDAKAFQAMKSSASSSTSARPELCVDLNGALIDQVDRGDKASVTSRKNVFLVSTVLGLQVLFQCDCSQQADDWYNAVHTAIHNLPSGFDSCPRIKVTKEMDRLFAEANSPEQTKKFPRIGRSKSVKIKNKDGSIEDLTVSPAERQTKIRARLKKFFNRRPTMESLVKKGIWKDEPAFGCYLEQVCGSESPRVPLFVQRCIAVIESNVDNMKTDGLYRASGNLSQVQKIRLQVDQNNLSALDQEEDVHVLTGALKLFFRELKEPLIPFSAFSKAIKASTNQNKKEKLSQFRDIVKSLPVANHDTLKFLLKHLLRVTSYQEFNRMHIPNLAIVFGPTLMWPEQESLNMALDLMQQNLVIETFLLDFENIFK